jgi:hypothetical protein
LLGESIVANKSFCAEAVNPVVSSVMSKTQRYNVEVVGLSPSLTGTKMV